MKYMDEFDRDILVISSIIVALLIGTGYTSYRVGKWKERKDYTLAFIQATQDTYQEAYADGEKIGKMEGIKEGYKKCLNEDFEAKDRY